MRSSAGIITHVALVLMLACAMSALAAEQQVPRLKVLAYAGDPAIPIAGVSVTVKTGLAAGGVQARGTDASGQATFTFAKKPFPLSLETGLSGCTAEAETRISLKEIPDAPVPIDVGSVVRVIVRDASDGEPLPGATVTLSSPLGRAVAVAGRKGVALFGCQSPDLEVSVEAAMPGYEFSPLLGKTEGPITEFIVAGQAQPSHQVLPATSQPSASR